MDIVENRKPKLTRVSFKVAVWIIDAGRVGTPIVITAQLHTLAGTAGV